MDTLCYIYVNKVISWRFSEKYLMFLITYFWDEFKKNVGSMVVRTQKRNLESKLVLTLLSNNNENKQNNVFDTVAIHSNWVQAGVLKWKKKSPTAIKASARSDAGTFCGNTGTVHTPPFFSLLPVLSIEIHIFFVDKRWYV